jgi:GMP synthase (glutamine-hydrolysing)
MSDKKQVWAIQHIGYEDLGSFENVLKSRGFEVKYFCSRNVDYKTMFANDPDLLIVLGGPMSVHDVENHPWIEHEQKFIEERIATEKPLMGICFGAQIIAQALGAKSYEGSQGKEIGWSKISVNADGQKTPFRHLDGSMTHMMHWHGNTFDLPDGAVLLASSDKYEKQAYSYGDHIFCMQCHPEVTEAKLRLWYSWGADQIEEVGSTIDQMKADAHAYNERLSDQSAKFLNEWLDEQGL